MDDAEVSSKEATGLQTDIQIRNIEQNIKRARIKTMTERVDW